MEKPLIEHERFLDTYNHMHALMNFHNTELVIALVGVGGVGKSTILDLLETELSPPRSGPTPDMPFVYTNCTSQHDSTFNWPDWYERVLIKMQEPGIEIKCSLNAEERAYINSNPLPNARSNRNARLRLSVEKALENRTTRWLILDEGHAMVHVPTVRQRAGQLESLKSLTINTETMIVTAGTPDLLHLFVPNSQLSRRTAIIHFDPYDADNESDLLEFSRTIKGFSVNSILPIETSLEWLTEFLYDCSQGAVGRASDHIELAGAIAKEAGKRKIGKKQLEMFRPLPLQLEQLKHDIRTARVWMQEGGLVDHSSLWMQEKYSDESFLKLRRNGKFRPGRRAPTNDPVDLR